MVTSKAPELADDPVDVLLGSPTQTPLSEADSAGARGDARSSSSAAGRRPSPVSSTKSTHPVVFATAIAAALALLVAGILVLQYEVYVQHPGLRDAYEIVGVDVPPYRALDAIRMTNATVDERVGDPQALIIRMDLTNSATRYQRFPMIGVRFHGEDGVLLGEQRRIEPAAYLASPGQSRRMTPARSTPVTLRLDDPGPDAASYSISLL